MPMYMHAEWKQSGLRGDADGERERERERVGSNDLCISRTMSAFSEKRESVKNKSWCAKKSAIEKSIVKQGGNHGLMVVMGAVWEPLLCNKTVNKVRETFAWSCERWEDKRWEKTLFFLVFIISENGLLWPYGSCRKGKRFSQDEFLFRALSHIQSQASAHDRDRKERERQRQKKRTGMFVCRRSEWWTETDSTDATDEIIFLRIIPALLPAFLFNPCLMATLFLHRG